MSNESIPVVATETLARAAVAVLVPYGGAGVIVYDAIRGRLSERMHQTAETILTEIGPDALAARLATSVEFEALVINALDTAARTGFDAKRRLLARVVISAALGDDAQVDESTLIEMAIRDLEGPHARALERMRIAQEDHRPSNGPLTDALIEAVSEVASREPEPIRSSLIRNGLVAPATVVGGGIAVAYVTDFGLNVLSELNAAHPVGPADRGQASPGQAPRG